MYFEYSVQALAAVSGYHRSFYETFDNYSVEKQMMPQAMLSRDKMWTIFGVAISMLLIPTLTHAQQFSWDWNDGTSQGWITQDFEIVDDQLQANGFTNGSLQFTSPNLPALGINATQVSILFDLTVDSFVAFGAPLNNPGELTSSRAIAFGPDANFIGISEVGWDLDLSGLEFGETRRFNLLFDDAELMLTDTKALLPIQLLDIHLAVPGFSHQSSVARIDNVVLTVVPEPSTLVPLAMIVLFNASSRRRGSCRIA